MDVADVLDVCPAVPVFARGTSAAAAASAATVGKTDVYVSAVIAELLCSGASYATFIGTPAASISDAAAWRRSWNPDRRQAGRRGEVLEPRGNRRRM